MQSFRKATYRCFALILGAVLATALARADAPAPGYDGVEVFAMPRLVLEETAFAARARAGDPDGAAKMIGDMIARYPRASRLRILRAALAMAQKDPDQAVAALLEADRLGAAGLGTLLANPPFDVLAGDARLAALADRPAPAPADPAPALVQDGIAPVSPGNSAWDPGTGRVRPRFAFPPILKTHAFADKPPEGPLKALQQLVARGQAAGNTGDLYDNRDDGHSTLRPGKRTQLTHVVYGPEARAAGIHYGLNTQILFETPTFGNSSTAVTGALWRSQPRFALTTPGGAFQLWQLYANNHLYVFPEHRDHDPEHGDLFPAATPYVLISQGSSGSDKPLLQAIQAILAAFRPDTKARLTETRLIAPMIQQIVRQSLVADREEYLGPLAHPTAIAKDRIDLARMIDLAQALAPDEIPPMVTLKLLRETPPDASIFAGGLTETLFDTPGAIARVWRGAQSGRQYELAAQAEDPNGRALNFHWRVLRGDPERVTIEPLDAEATRVRVTLGWQAPRPSPGRADIAVSRVDIAAFADNGAQLSAPAFFSVALPAHQLRAYTDDGRPLRIIHRRGKDAPYRDPLVWPRRGWEDRFTYAPDGALTGWVRVALTPKGTETRFSAQGHEVLESDAAGRPVLVREMRYPVSRTRKGGLAVIPAPGKRHFRIDYANAGDRRGRLIPVSE